MKVAIIGSGGREHAICFSLKNSSNVKKIFCFPGNAGTNSIATNIKIDLTEFEKTQRFYYRQ
jgi:phosphoribosylamine--glycine ligase